MKCSKELTPWCHTFLPNIVQRGNIVNILPLLHIWIFVTLNNKVARWVKTALMENCCEANSCNVIFIFINALESISETDDYDKEVREDNCLKEFALCLFRHDLSMSCQDQANLLIGLFISGNYWLWVLSIFLDINWCRILTVHSMK